LSGDARTFDYQVGGVGYVPFAIGHYIKNTGNMRLRFIEVFKSSYYADVSLSRWMALTPPELVQGRLRLHDDNGRSAQRPCARRASMSVSPGKPANPVPLR
jgi:oxalate decarboxylase/phosphoglucose isomerase-like protein (cupin superfamily)